MRPCKRASGCASLRIAAQQGLGGEAVPDLAGLVKLSGAELQCNGI
jgi:hypothetical protein